MEFLPNYQLRLASGREVYLYRHALPVSLSGARPIEVFPVPAPGEAPTGIPIADLTAAERQEIADAATAQLDAWVQQGG